MYNWYIIIYTCNYLLLVYTPPPPPLSAAAAAAVVYTLALFVPLQTNYHGRSIH